MDATTHPVEAVLGRWSDGPGPLHRKLTDAFRQAIDHGMLVAGQRLPSERELALRLAVSRSTVVAAYDTLRSEGLLESRQGSGTRIARSRGGQPIGGGAIPVSPVYRSLLADTGELISLACAAFPAHPLVHEALQDVAREDGDKLLSHTGYLPAGLPALREAIAARMSDDGTPTTPEQVLVTTGAQQAVHLAAGLLVRPGGDVVVESPTFAGVLDVFRTRGARLVTVPIDSDGIDVAAVTEMVASQQPSALYVMPSFHNPTGAMLSEARRRVLAELAETRRLPIIEDNALEHVTLDGAAPPPAIADYAPDAPILTAGSLSKAAWGGLRVGWLRGPVPLISRLAELKAVSDLGSPLLDQAVAMRIVPQLPRLREENGVTLRRNLELLCRLLEDSLPEWRWTLPRGGPSLWVRLPGGAAAAFAQVALRHGVEVIPGEMMSPHADHRDCLRLPFTAEPPVQEEIVRRLAAAWYEYAPRNDTPALPRSVVV